MKQDKRFTRKLNKKFASKVNIYPRSVGTMGDGLGNLYADEAKTKVYIRFGESPAIPVYNSRVAAENELGVVVGYSHENPNLYQVLSVHTSQPGGSTGGTLGSTNHARRHEWLAPRGGQDPLYVHLRAFTWLGIYVSEPNSMVVQLMRGNLVNASKVPLEIPDSTYDHTAHIPVTSGKAVLVLHTIDDTGANVVTVGSEFDIDLLMPTGDRFANMPAIPTDTLFVRGLVRVYNGQTEVQEGRTNRDIIDLRFSYFASASGAVPWSGITGKPTTWDDLWAELTGMPAGVAAIGDPLYTIPYVFATPPTANDDSSAGYKAGDLWINTAESSYYIAISVGVGAAVWLKRGGDGGDIVFGIDGALAVIASADTPYLVTKDMTIEEWYILGEDLGTAGSTIVDINLNGVTIFTVQGNRPELAYDDADEYAVSGMPDFTEFVKGDIISIDIDQAATGASTLRIIGLAKGSGGGGSSFNLTVEEEDGSPSVSNVGKIIVPNGSLTDDGGGQVTLARLKIVRGVASVVHSAAQDATVAVSFGTTFAVAPIVLVTTKDRQDMTFGSKSVLTTGFTLGSRFAGGALSATVEYYWMAIEV